MKITAWGETKSIDEWTTDQRCKAKYATIRLRIVKGWPPEDALSKAGSSAERARRRHPIVAEWPDQYHEDIAVTAWGETKSLVEWSRDDRCGAPPHIIHARLRSGQSAQMAISHLPKAKEMKA